MKKITLFSLSVLFLIGSLSAQMWTENLDQQKIDNGTLSLQDYQQAFYDYWAPYQVDNGYFFVNGEKIKAPGWKQFKRWEWKAQHLVDGEGNFPKTTTAEEMEKYYQQYPDAGKNLNGNWTNIGYNQTNGGYEGIGRVNCIAFHPTNNNIFWVGAPSGGLWITQNGGTSWTALTDANTVLGVSAIAVTSNYTTSNTIFIGTGDRDGGSAWSLGGGNTHDNNGIGVLKSTNGGTTWTSSLSFTPSQKVVVYDLLISPTNNNNLIAATSNGIYETTNGGTSWSVLTSNVCTDIEYQPGSSTIFYGAYINPIYIIKFTKTGGSWSWPTTPATLPGSSSVRTELAVSAANSAIVYAVAVKSNGGLEGIYKSTNYGGSYSLIYNGSTANQNLLGYDCNAAWVTYYEGQGQYDLFITANPSNANDVYVGGINVWRMDFSGTTPTKSLKSMWSGTCGGTVTEVHCDQHCCEFQNSSTLFIGNDGGIYKSTNAGTSWTDLSNNLTINQIYRIGQAPQTSNEILIGLQDNGSHLYSGGSWIMDGILGGDGMECLVDPNNTTIQFAELQWGEIYRTSDHWSNKINVRNNIRNSPSGSSGLAGDWVTPYTLDPNNSNNLFVGYDELWKSTDQGGTSTYFSKLTVSSYTGLGKMRSLEIAPSNSNYIYVSYAAYYISNPYPNPPTYVPSALHKSTNGGSTWTNITGTLPVSSGEITYICVKNNDPNTVWVTLGGYNSNAVYQTTNGGTSWTNISSGLPQIPAMSIVQNIKNTSMVELYVAMTQGVWVKYGAGNWASYSSGLPNVFCTELEIYYDNSTPSNSKLRVGTYGRGLWESTIPCVDFMASNNLPPNSITSVSFTDLSTNSPTGWFWTFSPATVTYVGGTNANSQNPIVQFMNPGAYNVTLTTTNALGNSSFTKTAYIHVGTPGLWTGTTSNAWNTTTNWHNHQIPVSAIGVTINPGAINWPVYSGNMAIGTDCALINMNGNAELTVTGNLTIPSGKTINCLANAKLHIGGDLLNYGGFNAGTSVVDMNGTTNASISGNSSSTGSQTTTYTGGSYTYQGGYFDIVASGGKSITVNSFDIHCTLGTTVNIEVWYKSGTYIGSTSNYGSWTQLGTTQTVTGGGWFNSTTVNPGASVTIPSGSTYGFYINCYFGSAGYLRFNFGSNSYSNSDITINTGDMAGAIPPGSGSWSGYTFNGTVYYSSINVNPITFYDLDINKPGKTVTNNGSININNDFTIKPGAWFTNANGNTLNVLGNVLIEDNSSSKGSLIDYGTSSVTGTNTVEAYYTDSRWHFISSPVSNALAGIFSGIYLKEWNESSYTWSYINSTTQALAVGEGYEIWSTVGNPTINYAGGSLNTGNVSPTVTATDSNGGGIGAGEGWNLVGNPYPSAIDWGTGNNPVSGYVRTNIDLSIYIWTGSQYATYNPNLLFGNGFGTNGGSRYIQSMQSFFVKANNTSPVLTIPNNARVHNASANLKTMEDVQVIHLKAEGNGDSDEILIEVNELSTVGFDKEYDAYKLFGSDESPQLFVINPDYELSVNAVPVIEPESEIPLGFKAGAINDYTITALSIENFDSYEAVLLEDLKTGLVTNLLLQPEYTFVSTPDDDPDRFMLKFTDAAIGVEEGIIEPAQIYSIDNRIYIFISDEKPGYELKVYNMLGQLIGTLDLVNQSINIFEVNEGTGFYLAEVRSDNLIKTSKILIK